MFNKITEYLKFPTKKIKFELYDEKGSSIERLSRRTFETKNFYSLERKNRSFKGNIQSDCFQLMVLLFGVTTMCVIDGDLNDKCGQLKVFIHPAFQWLLRILIFLPFIAISILAIVDSVNFSVIMILVAIFQALFIRFVIIAILFRYVSSYSIQRLKEVLDFQIIES